VNLASRLEGQCKTYGVGVTWGRHLPPDPGLSRPFELDMVMVKGKTEPERIYALVASRRWRPGPSMQSSSIVRLAFLRLYRMGSFRRGPRGHRGVR